MVRLTLITSVIAAAYAAVAAAQQIQGAYLVELEEGHDHAELVEHLGDKAQPRVKFDFKNFKGLSFGFNDFSTADEKAKQVAKLPGVKGIWPLVAYKPSGRTTQVVSPPPEKGKRSTQVEDKGAEADKKGIKGHKKGAKGHKKGAKVAEKTATSSDDAPANVQTTHQMTQVDKLLAKGITAKDVKIAFVDTGVDYGHSALGNGCFGKKECVVSFGTDLAGDAFNGDNAPVPDSDPMDCQGWGTFNVGIAAARPNPLGFTGAAPGAKIGMYKVFGCQGGTTNDILIAAVNQAYEDGANIIYLGIEQVGGWSDSPFDTAISRIVEKGVPCVVPAGDRGDAGLFFADSPAGGKGVTDVTSFQNTQEPLLSFHATYGVNGGPAVDFLHSPAASTVWGVTMPLYATSFETRIADDACHDLPANTPDLSQYIVLIRRGGCDFEQKLINVRAKGAKHAIIYNNEPTRVVPVLDDLIDFTAVSVVDSRVGAAWISELQAKRKVMVNVENTGKAKPQLDLLPNDDVASTVDTMASWGPTFGMEFKPQFGAPGSTVSTWPVNLGGYAIQSGTAQAGALVAAIMALVAEVRHTFDPRLLNDLLSATAKPQFFSNGENTFQELAPPPQQGCGLVKALDAAYTTSTLSPTSLSFNDTDNFAGKLDFTIYNHGNADVTYKLIEVPAITMYTLDKDGVSPMPFPNEAVNEQATISFSRNSVTVPRGQSAKMVVTAKQPSGVDPKRLALWSGFIIVQGSDKSELSLPYQGLGGSLRKATVLAPDQAWVYSSDDPKVAPIGDKAVFEVPPKGTATQADKLPGIAVDFALGCPALHVDVVPVGAGPRGKPLGEVFGMPLLYNPRELTTKVWDGRLSTGEYAPEGRYQLVARALKIRGDPARKEDYDVSASKPFVLTYRK